MNTEPTTHIDRNETPMALNRRGRLARTVAVTSLIALGIVYTANNGSSESPKVEEISVTVTPGDTVDGLIKEHVEHGASHTGQVRTYVMDLPKNAETFENGQLDPGETLYLPESAE